MPSAGVAALAAVGAFSAQAVLLAALSAATRYNPYDHSFLSMPRLASAWGVFASPKWRRAVRAAISTRVPVHVLGRLPSGLPVEGRSKLLRLGVRVVLAGVVAANMRLCGTFVGDRTRSIKSWKAAYRFVMNMEGGLRGLLRGTPYVFGAMTLEDDVGPLLHRLCRKMRLGLVAEKMACMLPVAASWWLWHQAETVGVFRYKMASDQGKLFNLPAVRQVALAAASCGAVAATVAC